MKIKFKTYKLSVFKKAQFVAAGILVVASLIILPVYAWLSNQRRAAEMYKVEYPNSLFVNAAHREDRKYFNLDGINVNEYQMTANNELARDDQGNLIQITEQYYVFSVSGSNTKNFLLQLAHTNNNKFTYTVYEATQYTSESAARAAATVQNEVDEKRVVTYTQNAGSHVENNIQVIGDEYVDNATSDLYYVRAENPISNGEYKNVSVNGSYPADSSGFFFTENYGSNSNVHSDAIPSYWQAQITLNDNEIDANKQFSKYFILKVSWGNEQTTQVSKETDIVYISVKRK